ncbi:MAG: hypothetical protein FD173_872 [Gallionellaceae bacterium]|nr:MAG: hypothetical protein FD173_872 [Gallionellaceae bacterium]
MSEFCLNLLCPLAVEEKLLDLLLMSPNVEVFTSTPTAAHGLASGHLSQTEQVLGRMLATQIQVLLSEADKEVLLKIIQQQFSGVGLRYWVSPVIDSGRFA